MKTKTSLFVILLAVTAGSLLSQDFGSIKLKEKFPVTTNFVSSKPIELSRIMDIKLSSIDNQELISKQIAPVALLSDSLNNNLKGTQYRSKKSPILAGLFSAILPGSGEFYGGDYLKAAIFFGVEAASWGVYAYLNHKGDVKTTEFQNYANQYWSVRKYAQWLKDSGFNNAGGINPDEPNLEVLRSEIMACESVNFSHTLPEYGSQQFYELIGKYQNFQAGWTNLAHDPTKSPGPYYYETYRDPVFVNYADNRQKANDYYDYATTSIWFVVLNHILSTADAIWTVTKYNKNLTVQTGFRMNRVLSPYTYQYETMPTLNVAFNF